MSLSRRILPTTQAMWDRIEELEARLSSQLENDSDLPDWGHALYLGNTGLRLYKFNAPAWAITYSYQQGANHSWTFDKAISVSHSVAGYTNSSISILPINGTRTCGDGHGAATHAPIAVGNSTYMTFCTANCGDASYQRYVIVPTIATVNWLLSNDIPLSLVYTDTGTSNALSSNQSIPDFEYENDPNFAAMREGDWRDNFDLETKGLNPTYAYQS